MISFGLNYKTAEFKCLRDMNEWVTLSNILINTFKLKSNLRFLSNKLKPAKVTSCQQD